MNPSILYSIITVTSFGSGTGGTLFAFFAALLRLNQQRFYRIGVLCGGVCGLLWVVLIDCDVKMLSLKEFLIMSCFGIVMHAMVYWFFGIEDRFKRH